MINEQLRIVFSEVFPSHFHILAIFKIWMLRLELWKSVFKELLKHFIDSFFWMVVLFRLANSKVLNSLGNCAGYNIFILIWFLKSILTLKLSIDIIGIRLISFLDNLLFNFLIHIFMNRDCSNLLDLAFLKSFLLFL